MNQTIWAENWKKEVIVRVYLLHLKFLESLYFFEARKNGAMEEKSKKSIKGRKLDEME